MSRRGAVAWLQTKRVSPGVWLESRFAFDSRRKAVSAAVAVMLLGGLVSLLRGQDANWDLRNYHLYNGYAWLHDRLALDLAPAQMQSYFSPLLDVLHAGLMLGLPAPVGGFVLGVLHGAVFVPLSWVIWQVLGERPDRARLAPLLAFAGLCTAAFLSEFGNTMGDNLSAGFVIAALALAMQARRFDLVDRAAATVWCLAGAALGMAVAFKLTNALYAVALGVAVLLCGGRWRTRIVGGALLTMSACTVFVLLAGHWYFKVWETFGNPLFPQFNAIFHGPLAQPMAIADTRWLPRTWGEQLTWPWVFTLHPRRVSEIPLRQISWGILYLLALAAVFRKVVMRRSGGGFSAALPFLLAFFVVAYVLWQVLFSVHRYLVTLELLSPLLVWLGCRFVLPVGFAGRSSVAVVAACALVALWGWADWRHEPWASKAFAIQAPEMVDPARSMVLLVGGEPPQAWKVPLLPAAAAYASVGSNFPESPAYVMRLHDMAKERPAVYAMLEAAADRKAARLATWNGWAARFGLDRQPQCSTLGWLIRKRVLKGSLLGRAQDGRCLLVPVPGAGVNVDAFDAEVRANVSTQLMQRGFGLQDASCRRLTAWIGGEDMPYQWCRVRRLD